MAKKQDNTIIWGALLLFGGVYLYKKFVTPAATANTQQPVTTQPNTSTGNNTGTTTGNNTNPGTITSGYPVYINQYNSNAKALQKVLGVTQDGIIGPVTLTALNQKDPDGNWPSSGIIFNNAQQLSDEISFLNALTPTGIFGLDAELKHYGY